MKKAVFLGIILLLISSLLSGCGQSTSANQTAVQKKNIVEDQVLLFVSNEGDEYLGDLYLKKGTGEKEKLSSNVQNNTFYFLGEKNAVVFLDKENNLYIKENSKEKELISSDATPNYYFLGNESGIVFLKGETNDLYIKLWGKEKEKIASGVTHYDFTPDGKTLGFIDEDNNLYVKKEGAEKEKLASSATFFYISDNGSIFYYFNTDYNLYVRDLSKPDNEKLVSGQIMDIQVSSDGKMITYLNEYNYDKGKGELYFLKEGESPKKIASDVTDYQLCNDNQLMYYLNEENNLFSTELAKDEKNKIAGEVIYFTASSKGDTVIYENSDGNIYLKANDKEKEKIGDNVKRWSVIDNHIIYLTEDKELYLKEADKEKEKLSTDIQNYVVSEFGKTLIYYTTGFELHLKVFGKDVQKVVDNINDFSKIYFSNTLLFAKELRVDDLQGIWSGTYDGDNFFIEITKDSTFKIYFNGELQGETKVSMENPTLTSGTLVLEENPDYYHIFDGLTYLSAAYHSEKEVVIEDVSFTKITRQDLETKLAEQKKVIADQIALQNKIDEANNLADEILYTYQVVTDPNANYRETPSVNGNLLGTLNQGAEFYIDNTYVDENGTVWCYVSAYDQNGNYMTGWTAYINFK